MINFVNQIVEQNKRTSKIGISQPYNEQKNGCYVQTTS